MQAIVFDRKGSPRKYTLREMEKPVPDANEILIRVQTASVNAADYRSVAMRIVPKSGVLGSGVVGTVESVGKDVRIFQPGDQVIADIADSGFGGFAEYAIAPEHIACHKPESLSFVDAATLPVAATTGLHAVRDIGGVQSGQKVLIVGSSGGVGSFALQLAKYYGAEVTAVCSSRNKEQSLALGADHVIDYTQEDFTKKDQQYDLVIAINGNYSLLACKRVLKEGGSYVMVGGSLKQIFKALLFGRFLSMGSKKIKTLTSKPNAEDLAFVASLMQEGTLKPVIEKEYPFHQTGEAMEYLAAGHAKGKVVINVSE